MVPLKDSWLLHGLWGLYSGSLVSTVADFGDLRTFLAARTPCTDAEYHELDKRLRHPELSSESIRIVGGSLGVNPKFSCSRP